MTLRSLNCEGCGQTFPTIESLIIHKQSCSKLNNMGFNHDKEKIIS